VFAAQGVNIHDLAKLQFRFGYDGMPTSGSIQLADVRFQETAAGSQILSDGWEANGAGYGPSKLGGPDPATELYSYNNAPGQVKLPDTVGNPQGNTTWTVDDDKRRTR
jgi:hypothetical protein